MPDGRWLDPATFIVEVREASRIGYFSFNSVVETFTHCFAAPVYQADGTCVATLCLVAPREDGLKNHERYLGVWSRNEMARVDFEGGGVVRPGVADGLVGCPPFQRL